MVYMQFILSAIAVAAAGTYLAKFGDVIAKRTGLGGMWIGAFLLAAATSLPEVISDVSAAILGVPELAVGDIFGSGMANMLLLGVIGLFFQRVYRRPSLLKEVTLTHSATAMLAILLTSLAGTFILLRSRLSIVEVGASTIVLAAVYAVGMWTLYGYEREKADARAVQPGGVGAEEMSLRAALTGFIVGTAVIAIASPFLVLAADAIAKQTGIGASFMGTLFLALVTSAPEFVVSIAAIRIGAFDLAVGDLFGSNAFNIFILFLVDIAYRKGPLLFAISPTNAVTAMFLVILMSIGVAGVVFRAKQQYFLVVPESIILISLYAVMIFTLFKLSAGG